MSKSGLYINGKKVCDITDKTKIELVPQSINIQGDSLSVINSSNSQIINSFNNNGNSGFVNQGVHRGDIHIENSKIIVDNQELLIGEYTNQQDVKIEIYGDVESVCTKNGSLNVSANNIKNVESKNGNINVNASAVGSIETKNGVINKFG